VAGVIAGNNRECAGLAPEAEIHSVSDACAPPNIASPLAPSGL
jgi:hypothetical protein